MGYIVNGGGGIAFPADLDMAEVWLTLDPLLQECSEVVESNNGFPDRDPHDVWLQFCQKYYYQEHIAFYDALAALGVTGCFDMVSEEGNYWRIRFADGAWTEHTGEIVYPTDSEVAIT